jgi:hypothetical protein
MAGEFDTLVLTDNLKNIYGDLLEKPPAKFPLLSGVKFRSGQKPGKAYVEAVLLTFMGQFDYRTADEAVGAYATAIPSTIKDATIVGTNLHGFARIGFEACARGATSAQAFKDNVGVVLKSLFQSAQDRLECSLWSGAIDIGVIEKKGGEAAVAPGTGNLGANDIQISFDSWAVGNWAAKENANVNILSTNLKAVHDASAIIVKVDLNTRIITLDAATGGYTDGDRVIFDTSYDTAPCGGGAAATTREMQGIHALLSSAGTVLGISTDYSMWSAPSVAVGGILSLNSIMAGISAYYNKGNDDDFDFYCGAGPWTTVASEWSALKRFQNTDKSYLMGSDELSIIGLGIKTDIKVSRYCRSGEGVGISEEKLSRIGAQELASQVVGKGGDLFVLVPGYNAFEHQVYANFALFLHPSECVRYSGITG